MSDEDEAVMRWLGERYQGLLGELVAVLDVEAGLASIVGDSPDSP
ncbi:hypothetical protein [Streptomyces sp. UNOC14_S4]|nr:hypothetical protein [Streptomyces sp. UNOC14_S4]